MTHSLVKGLPWLALTAVLASCGAGSKAAAPATTTAQAATTTTVALSDAATTWCLTTENQRMVNKAASTLGVTPLESVDLLTAKSVDAFWQQWGAANRAGVPTYPVPSTLDEQNAVVQYGPTSWFTQDDWVRVCNAAFGAR